ncbi:MAG: hypothetical protein ACON5H_07740 [Akkermansiaceae bacterium]
MKKLTTTILMALALSMSAHADPFKAKAAQVSALYQKAVKEMHEGKIEEARTHFQKLLKLQPNHGHAKYHLARLDVVGKNFALAQRKKLFTSTKIANIDFHEATLQEVLEHLNEEVQKVTHKGFSPNFIIQDPKGTLKNKEITLAMKKVPLSAVLKYVLEMTGSSVRFDTHATVIRPN